MTGSIPPPPGWYPDPWGQRPWRWWDGGRWTEHAADPSTPGPAVGSGPPAWPATQGPASGWPVVSAQEGLAAETRMAPWAERGFAWYVVVIVCGLLVAWSESSYFRQIFHEFRVQVSTGVDQPALHTSIWRTDLLSLVNLVVAAPFYVLVLIWQFRAATTARRLMLPAAHSPGLGVGSWFIPVVNFWFPYQALRDCLPPEHPDRRTVAVLWACFIGVLVLTPVTDVLMLVGTPVAYGFAAPALALGVGFSLSGVRTVQAIARSHRQLLGPAEATEPSSE